MDVRQRPRSKPVMGEVHVRTHMHTQTLRFQLEVGRQWVRGNSAVSCSGMTGVFVLARCGAGGRSGPGDGC